VDIPDDFLERVMELHDENFGLGPVDGTSSAAG
jgi:hypothetical protein